ncbi:hypothetical protein ACPC54_26875 [Kitasatospora sp. NPDC094028]
MALAQVVLGSGRSIVLHFSRLVVVWFQPDSDLSSLGRVAPGLCDVPWDEKAEDLELQSHAPAPGTAPFSPPRAGGEHG